VGGVEQEGGEVWVYRRGWRRMDAGVRRTRPMAGRAGRLWPMAASWLTFGRCGRVTQGRWRQQRVGTGAGEGMDRAGERFLAFVCVLDMMGLGEFEFWSGRARACGLVRFVMEKGVQGGSWSGLWLGYKRCTSRFPNRSWSGHEEEERKRGAP
jgi:hypothetical protein